MAYAQAVRAWCGLSTPDRGITNQESMFGVILHHSWHLVSDAQYIYLYCVFSVALKSMCRIN